MRFIVSSYLHRNTRKNEKNKQTRILNSKTYSNMSL